ncbi:MAG: hypothetical protein K8U57_39285 [Planctomycetes bacterium]|nr:hypothetical protein [Planctomycetota bacterium]
MKASRVLLAVMLVSVLGSGTRAAEPTKQEIEDATKRASILADIAFAADLAAFGRGQGAEGTSPKDFKSPESLVLAGGILMRAHKATAGKSSTLDAKPTDEKGNPIKGDAVKTPSLAEQADALFVEAEAMGVELKDKSRAATLDAMIKREKASEADRGGIGGPNTITRVLQAGETHTYPVAFFSGQPAAVAMTSSGPAKIQFDLGHAGGAGLFSLKGHNANYNWTPQRDKDNVRRFTIKMTNLGNKPTTYTLTTN